MSAILSTNPFTPGDSIVIQNPDGTSQQVTYSEGVTYLTEEGQEITTGYDPATGIVTAVDDAGQVLQFSAEGHDSTTNAESPLPQTTDANTFMYATDNNVPVTSYIGEDESRSSEAIDSIGLTNCTTASVTSQSFLNNSSAIANGGQLSNILFEDLQQSQTVPPLPVKPTPEIQHSQQATKSILADFQDGNKTSSSFASGGEMQVKILKEFEEHEPIARPPVADSRLNTTPPLQSQKLSRELVEKLKAAAVSTITTTPTSSSSTLNPSQQIRLIVVPKSQAANLDLSKLGTVTLPNQQVLSLLSGTKKSEGTQGGRGGPGRGRGRGRGSTTKGYYEMMEAQLAAVERNKPYERPRGKAKLRTSSGRLSKLPATFYDYKVSDAKKIVDEFSDDDINVESDEEYKDSDMEEGLSSEMPRGPASNEDKFVGDQSFQNTNSTPQSFSDLPAFSDFGFRRGFGGRMRRPRGTRGRPASNRGQRGGFMKTYTNEFNNYVSDQQRADEIVRLFGEINDDMKKSCFRRVVDQIRDDAFIVFATQRFCKLISPWMYMLMRSEITNDESPTLASLYPEFETLVVKLKELAKSSAPHKILEPSNSSMLLMGQDSDSLVTSTTNAVLDENIKAEPSQSYHASLTSEKKATLTINEKDVAAMLGLPACEKCEIINNPVQDYVSGRFAQANESPSVNSNEYNSSYLPSTSPLHKKRKYEDVMKNAVHMNNDFSNRPMSHLSSLQPKQSTFASQWGGVVSNRGGKISGTPKNLTQPQLTTIRHIPSDVKDVGKQAAKETYLITNPDSSRTLFTIDEPGLNIPNKSNSSQNDPQVAGMGFAQQNNIPAPSISPVTSESEGIDANALMSLIQDGSVVCQTTEGDLLIQNPDGTAIQLPGDEQTMNVVESLFGSLVQPENNAVQLESSTS